MSFVDEHYCTILQTLATSFRGLSIYNDKGAEAANTNASVASSTNRTNVADKTDSSASRVAQEKLMQRVFDISTQVLALQRNSPQPTELESFDMGAAQSSKPETGSEQKQGRDLWSVDKDVARAKSPSMASVINDLGLVREVCRCQAANASTQAQDEAVNLVLLNSVAAIHAHMVGQLLDTVLPLSIDIDYWNSQDDGVATLALYLVQSLPWRLAGWGSDIAGTVFGFVNGRKGSVSESVSALYSSISTKQLFPEVVLSLEKDEDNVCASTTAIAPLLRVPRSANVLSLTRREIRYKLRKLEDAQNLLAAMIGQLCQATVSTSTSSDEKAASGMNNIDIVMRQIEQILAACIEKSTQTADSKPDLLPDTEINRICQAEELAKKAQTASAQFTQRLERYRRPSLIARGWLPALAFIFCARQLTLYISDNREDFKAWLLDGAATLQNYVAQYILAPLRSAYETIRYGKHSYSVVTEESLLSDFRSLEDMVVGFARRFGSVDAADVRRRVESGDLSDVMQVYAREMQQPFKNAVFGDLVEAMLIQVQKVKVDVGQTMAALDKLLKSNELNFLLLSTVPATLSIYAAGRWISSRFSWWVGGSSRYTVSSISVVMRDIDRLLNNSGHEETNAVARAGCTTMAVAHGKLICFTHYLRHHARVLPDSGACGKVRVGSGWVSTLPRTRTMFLQDIRDIESVALDNAQKRNVVDRMYRTFRFL
ncbi:Intraflagellar transport protein 88 [Coemansia sp. RSA 486]|nr:Intraflagellar transport protein 88 [Coemansia sp. RSA 486]